MKLIQLKKKRAVTLGDLRTKTVFAVFPIRLKNETYTEYRWLERVYILERCLTLDKQSRSDDKNARLKWFPVMFLTKEEFDRVNPMKKFRG